MDSKAKPETRTELLWELRESALVLHYVGMSAQADSVMERMVLYIWRYTVYHATSYIGIMPSWISTQMLRI